VNAKQIERLAKLIHQKSMNLTLFEAETLIANWFKNNPVEPVVVGLTDEQVADFVKHWSSGMSDSITEYHEWAKTQTFAQSQQFQPDWSKIPDDSTIDGCRVDLTWICCGGLIERETLATFERPPDSYSG
jgi:hypothetical protein